MERSVQYTWLESEALAIARTEFRDMYCNNAVLLILFAVFYVPVAWDLWTEGSVVLSEFYSLASLIAPAVLLALGYFLTFRSAKDNFEAQSRANVPVTFAWSESGLKAVGKDWELESPWHDYVKVDETDRFIRLHPADQRRPAYVFKRPLSAEQLDDFRRCVAIIRPESATFL